MTILPATAYSFTQIGERDTQQDSRFPDSDSVSPEMGRCFIICDGVGGSRDSDIASGRVARAIGLWLLNTDPHLTLRDADMARAVGVGYRILQNSIGSDSRDMATTLALLYFGPGGGTAIHIGDSRIYQIRPGVGIIYRSEDHSLVNALVRSGTITPAEAPTHRMKNIITRSMRASGEPDKAFAVTLTDVREGDYFLLTSDGVTSCVSDDELCDILSEDLPAAALLERIRELCSGCADNNTCWLIPVAEVTGAPAMPRYDSPQGDTIPIMPGAAGRDITPDLHLQSI